MISMMIVTGGALHSAAARKASLRSSTSQEFQTFLPSECLVYPPGRGESFYRAASTLPAPSNYQSKKQAGDVEPPTMP